MQIRGTMIITLIPGITTGLKRTDASKTSMSLGVLALAASLERKGYTVNIKDIDFLIDEFHWSVDEFLYQKVAIELLKTEAKIYGFYVACGTLHHAVNISSEIKKINPNVIITFGGPHATAVKNQILENFTCVDYITRGEGDETIVEFAEYVEDKRLLNEVGNLTYRLNNGEIRDTHDATMISQLDSLPVPAYYKHKSDRDILDIIPIDVGRGCPYNCTFCSTSVFWKKRYRVKSIGRIVEEMKYVKQLFGAKKVFLMHDCLTADRKMLFEICDAIIDADLDLEWGCAARLDHINEDVLQKLREAHCSHLEIGIESGSELVRASINKKLDSSKDSILEKLQMIHNYGISLVLFYICGFPTETETDIKATLNMIRDTLDIMQGNGFFRLTYLELFAGTEMYKTEKKNAIFSKNLIDDESIRLYSDYELELAQKTDVFPEFYYVANKDISPLYFRELSSVYSSFIKVLGTEFYMTYSLLLNCFNNNIHLFFETWKGFEKKNGEKYRESGRIISKLQQYIEYLADIISLPSYIDDTLKYEMAVYYCRQEYLRQTLKHKPGKILLTNAALVKLNSNVASFFEQIKNKNFSEVTPELNTCFYVILMQTSEKIKVLKVNEVVHNVLLFCDGTYSKKEALEKYISSFADMSQSEDNLITAFESVVDYFRKLNVIKGD